MRTPAPAHDLEFVRTDARAAVLMHPLRRRILQLAVSPASATQLAGRLGLARQKVNYHVRELASARFLRRAGRTRKRNAIEQRYVATARAYVLGPQVLGDLGPQPHRIADQASMDYLVALATRLHGELAVVAKAAATSGKRVATLSLDAEIRFTDAAQRERFAAALRNAVSRVIAEHAGPADSPSKGRPFRLMVGCYPRPSKDATIDPGEHDA